MALLNPSFEDAGALPGEAEHWTFTAGTSLEELAGFGTAPEEAWEDFERWFDFLASIEEVVVVLAFFDSALQGYEAFEPGWANAAYLHELPPAQLITATFDGNPAEDWETGWSNVPYAHDWELVTAAAGMFDGEPREAFETWFDAAPPVWQAAFFAPDQAETFSGTWTVMDSL